VNISQLTLRSENFDDDDNNDIIIIIIIATVHCSAGRPVT